MESSSQSFLEIQNIKEGVVMLKNGGIRGVLMVSSINFALKSSEEQQSIIFAFQSFLNSLDFSCQIVMQSRRINITPYLDTVKALEEKQTNELLKQQTTAYREFIKELVQGGSIMTKSFYVVVPYTLTEILGVGAVAKHQLKDDEFEKVKNQLWQRMEFLAMGLKRCGLEIVPLTTPELIELYWSLHHPTEAENGYYPEILPELLQ